MTKRLLALFLVCILAIPILVVPAAATSIDETEATEPDYTNILDVISQNTWDIRARLTAILNEIQGNVTGWNIHSLLTSIKDSCANIYSILMEKMQLLLDGISDIYDAITTTLFSFLNEISLRVGYILSEVGSIGDKLNEIINGDESQQEEVDDQKQQVETQATEFEEYLDTIQDVTRPTYEDVDLSLEGITDNVGISAYMISMKAVLSKEVFLRPMFMASIFAAISFVLFGKV